MANGVRSYSKAYEKDINEKKQYDVCGSGALENLRKPQIKAYMRELLEASGFNDESIDGRLKEIVYGGKDSDSMSAIKEYNALQKRVTKKIEHSGSVNHPVSEDDLDKIMRKIKGYDRINQRRKAKVS